MDFGDILIYITSYFGLFTAIFFFLTLFENRKKIKNPKYTRLPSVTIAVPAFNEEHTIAKTIKSLLRLDYKKKKIRIIVVDDGSLDKTYSVAKKFECENLKVYRKKNGGKGTALNFALEKTNTELFGALDADSFVRSDALKKMIGYFENPKVMAVTPSLKVYKPKNILQKIQYIEYLMGIFLRKIFAFLGSIHVTPGPFTIYRVSFFRKYGGYDSFNPTEDIEIALRIQEKKGIIENSVDATVHTVTPASFNELLKQRVRWYSGFTQNVMDYKHLFSYDYGNLGMFILPASFASVLLVVVSLFYTIYKIITRTIIQNLLNWNYIDFDFWRLFDPNFDFFFFNTNSIAFLSVTLLLLGILVIYTAKKISKEKKKIKFFYAFYLVLYWALFGFWWAVAGIYRLAGKKIMWGQRTL